MVKIQKKAQGLSINAIILAVIALVVLVVLVAIFTGRIGIFSGAVGQTGDATKTCAEQSGTPSIQCAAGEITIASKPGPSDRPLCCKART